MQYAKGDVNPYNIIIIKHEKYIIAIKHNMHTLSDTMCGRTGSCLLMSGSLQNLDQLISTVFL